MIGALLSAVGLKLWWVVALICCVSELIAGSGVGVVILSTIAGGAVSLTAGAIGLFLSGVAVALGQAIIEGAD